MKKKLLIILTAIFVVVLSFGLTACNPTPKITIVAPDGAPALSITNIVKDGLSSVTKGEELAINIQSPAQVKADIEGKKCDIAIVPTNIAYAIYKNSLEKGDKDPYIMLATSTYGNLFIVGKNVTNNINDLVGKVVYSIGENAVPHKVFEKIAKSNGLELNKIENIVNAQPDKINVIFKADGPAILGALDKANAEGKEAYGLLGEPAVSTGAKAKGYKVCFDIQQLYKDATNSENLGYPQAIVVARQSFINSHNALVKEFLNKMVQNIEFINNTTEPNTITDILQKNCFGTKSASNFPPATVKGCNIKVLSAQNAKNDVKMLLNNIFPFDIDDAFFSDITL